MMKKNNKMRVVICILGLVALMSQVAFASTGLNFATTDSGDKTEAQTQTTPEEQAGDYMTVEGTITSADKTDDGFAVQIDDGGMGMIFHVQEGVLVLDQATGNYLKQEDLKKDMKVVAVLAKASPTTMSIPPQTAGVVCFVIKSEAGSVDVSVYGDDLVNEGNTLKLNIADNTTIQHISGNKMAYNADSLKGSELLVLYTASTRSIPAQTSPEFVLILNTADELSQQEASEGTKALDSAPVDEPQAIYVELRATAEAKGYKVEWTSNKAPIVLTKDDMTIEITVGSDAFNYTHMTLDMQPLDHMEKLSLPAKLENGKTMVPADFVEAMK